ncbi:hypothetical protein PHLCEN_2v510 [Hermanssonia centrifuga]|uniref:Carbohydrate kinase PfkB domain-containing protein n=1 Tax=Hermanssonia centrifuga TaxID=98765 RepID=A0A2R6S5Z6_9APHY|nr:hypothetical protein PHLCEN_2v510 [Hermanssonia centrifuga]
MLRRALFSPTKCTLRSISSLPTALSNLAPIDVHPEVQEALAKHRPVVALETTIITHGMPHPTNLETARSVEGIVRDQGAIPATIGIIGGRIKIGLTPQELEHLAHIGNANPPAVKVSRRDIGPAIALKRDGGTTCSATLIFAAMAGIKQQLGLANGVLFGVPIPEDYEAVGEQLQQAVEQAVIESEENGISKCGKAATPWLLNRVGELTQGRSLASNVALIQNTARVGGQIAVAYARLSEDQRGLRSSSTYPTPDYTSYNHGATNRIDSTVETATKTPESDPYSPAELLVIGSVAVDITAQAKASDIASGMHSTTPGSVSMTLGGVGRNIAEAAHRILTASSSTLSRATVLVSPVGQDSFGRLLTEEIGRLGMRTDGIFNVDSGRSAVCNMILDGSGGLISGVADMGITERFDPKIAIEAIAKYRPKIVAVDGNLSELCLGAVIGYCKANNIGVFFEPTSIVKSTRILSAIATSLKQSTQVGPGSPVMFASPNVLELTEMHMEARSEPLELTTHPTWWDAIDNMALGTPFRMNLEQLARQAACDHSPAKGTLAYLLDKGVAQMAVQLLPFFQHLIVKCGDLGIFTVFRIPADVAKESAWVNERTNIKLRQVVAQGKDGEIVVLKHFPALPLPEANAVNVTGAGDSVVGSILASAVENPIAFQDPATLDRVVERAQKVRTAS